MEAETNWRPPKPEELHKGLRCQIIDIARSADAIQAVNDIKKHFKREVEPQLIYKDHVLTERDIEYYTLNPHLIKRDLRIVTDL